MAHITRFGSTKVTLRSKANFSENAFPGKSMAYSKRKAEFSPPKTKITKRPALNDLTNDGKMRKVKSIIKNDKSLNVIKDEKCTEKDEDALKVKSTRSVTGVRLPPLRPSGSTKFKNEPKLKIAGTKTKPASKSAVQQTKPVMVQTLLTAHTGNGHLRRSSRLQNENEISKKESTTKKESATRELLEKRRSLRSRESIPKEAREPTVVIKKVEIDKPKIEVEITISVNEAPAGNEVKPARRSSARLSLRKSSTVDKSLESNSLYVSALEDLSNRDKKYDWEELTEFDKELLHDPHQVALYAAEIFHYLKSREAHFVVSDYMSRLPDITKEMRMILVDWMVEVQENFELNHETLYLSVKIVDAYLDKITEIRRDKLQLVGVSAMFVACKYDERLSPLLDDFVYVCDGAYEPKDILAMEQRLLETLKYELSFPISYSFLRRYARCARVPMPLLTLARYILELSLIDYSTVTLSDSKQAAAALYLAFRMVKHSDWTESLASYSGYKLEDFKDIVLLFNSILHKKFPEEVKAVRTKYSHEIFFEVSKTRLISDEELKEIMAEHS